MIQYKLDIIVNNKKHSSLKKGVARIVRKLDTRNPLFAKITKKELRIFLNDIASVMETRHSKSFTGSKSTVGRLQKRSGEGVASIRRSITLSGNNIKNIIGTMGGLSRLTIHEFGGSITPKSRKFLTIPLPAALDSRGIPKRLSVRDWENTAVIKTAGGRLMVIQRRGRRIIPLYILAKKVTIPARLGMRASAEKRLSAFGDKLANVIVRELSKELVNA